MLYTEKRNKMPADSQKEIEAAQIKRAEIAHRFKEAREFLRLNRKDFGSDIGLGSTLVRNIELGLKICTLAIALDIEDTYKINSGWLLEGEGSFQDVETYSLRHFGRSDGIKVNLIINQYPNIYASAGNGFENQDEEVSEISLDRQLLPTETYAGHIDLIKVHGESMCPTLDDGDRIFLNKDRQELLNKKIYVLKVEDKVYVKRIYKTEDPYTIIMKSDNIDKDQFPDKTVSLNTLTVIGQVIQILKEV